MEKWIRPYLFSQHRTNNANKKNVRRKNQAKEKKSILFGDMNRILLFLLNASLLSKELACQGDSFYFLLRIK